MKRFIKSVSALAIVTSPLVSAVEPSTNFADNSPAFEKSLNPMSASQKYRNSGILDAYTEKKQGEQNGNPNKVENLKNERKNPQANTEMDMTSERKKKTDTTNVDKTKALDYPPKFEMKPNEDFTDERFKDAITKGSFICVRGYYGEENKVSAEWTSFVQKYQSYHVPLQFAQINYEVTVFMEGRRLQEQTINLQSEECSSKVLQMVVSNAAQIYLGHYRRNFDSIQKFQHLNSGISGGDSRGMLNQNRRDGVSSRKGVTGFEDSQYNKNINRLSEDCAREKVSNNDHHALDNDMLTRCNGFNHYLSREYSDNGASFGNYANNKYQQTRDSVNRGSGRTGFQSNKLNQIELDYENEQSRFGGSRGRKYNDNIEDVDQEFNEVYKNRMNVGTSKNSKHSNAYYSDCNAQSGLNCGNFWDFHNYNIPPKDSQSFRSSVNQYPPAIDVFNCPPCPTKALLKPCPSPNTDIFPKVPVTVGQSNKVSVDSCNDVIVPITIENNNCKAGGTQCKDNKFPIAVEHKKEKVQDEKKEVKFDAKDIPSFSDNPRFTKTKQPEVPVTAQPKANYQPVVDRQPKLDCED